MDERKNKSIIPPSTGSVSTLYARALVDYLKRINFDIDQLFEPSLIAQLNDSESRIPSSIWHMMLNRAIEETGDLDIPLKVSEQLEPKHLGILGFAIMSSRTLQDVVAILLRFESLIGNSHTTELIEHGDTVELHWLPLFTPPPSIFMKQSLVSWLVIARQVTSKPDLICDVHFSFEQPEQLQIYQRIFGGHLYFNAPITKMVFHRSVLELPITLSNPTTNSILMTQVEQELQSLTQPDFLQKLRTYLIANLSSNQVSVTDAAQALDISVRTLQYQLAGYGLGYRNLLEQIRQEQAEHYLRTTDLSLNEITFLLGYAEQSSFQNAFRRWVGESPGSFRKNLGR